MMVLMEEKIEEKIEDMMIKVEKVIMEKKIEVDC